MADFYIAQGDTASALSDTLTDAEGSPVNLQGASAKLTLTPLRGGTPIVNAAAAVIDQVGDGSDGSKGKLHRDWTAGETDEPGDYLGQWVVTFSGGKVQSFPNSGYLLVTISPDAPTSAGTYLTLEELKKSLNLTGQTFADGDLELAIAAAGAAIESLYGGPWKLGSPGEARYFTPTQGLTTVELGLIETVTEVALDAAGAGAYDRLLVDGTDYALEPADGPPWRRLRFLRSGVAWLWNYPPWRGSAYPWGLDALRVTGTWGSAETPAGVSVAVSIVASRFMRRLREAPFGVLGLGPEGITMRAGSIARDPDVAAAMKGPAGPRRLIV